MAIAYETSKMLARRGHDVEVYATNALDQKKNFRIEGKEEMVDGFRVKYFSNVLRFDNVFIAPELIRALRTEVQKFDIVHLHFGRQLHDIAVGYFSRIHDIPYVLQAHGAIPRFVAKEGRKLAYDLFFGNNLLANASRIVAASRMESRRCEGFGVPSTNISIIPNGINMSEYSRLPQKGEFKRKYGINGDKKILLYLGRIHKIKGLDCLIKAFSMLVRQLNFDDVLLAVVGPDDGYLHDMELLIEKKGMRDYIILTGPLYDRNKLEVYVDSEVYILPSVYESFGITLLEAFACSKPVIASNIDSISEIVLDQKTGFLFDAGNALDLAKKMAQMIDSPEEAEIMGNAGRVFVKDRYSAERTTSLLEDLYNNILGEK